MADQRRDIGRFSGATLIGWGGFGSVYRATDAEHGREVAVKVLQGTLGDTERRRFDRERQTMGRLGAHPNIMPVHESGYTERGEGYLVMELAPHGSLADRLGRDGTIRWPDAVGIMVDIARATQAAHDQGVLHRDIKPDNILIDAYHNPRLTDFGIAAVASNATATTSTTATIAHAAPEVLEGWPPTPAIDIYALGSTLANLVLGRPPFQDPNDHGVSAMIARAMTAAPPDLRPHGVPDAVAAVVERALAKDPAERQASAAQLADELVAAASSSTGAGGPGSGLGAGAASEATIVTGGPLPWSDRSTLPGTAGAALGRGAGSPAPSAPNPVTAPTQIFSPHPDGAGTTTPAGPGLSSGGGPWAGTGTPVEAYASARADHGPIRRGRPLLVAAGVVLAVVVGVVGTLLVVQRGQGGDGGTTAAGAANSATTTAGADTTADTTTDTTGPSGAGTEATGGGPTPTAPTVSTTATTTVTTATAPTTITSTTVTATEPPPAGPCPRAVLTAESARFDVAICGDGFGGLTYIGTRRDSGASIELAACYAGDDVFIATNEGFAYFVDAARASLVVVDPDGATVVDDALHALIVDRSIPAGAC